MTPRPTSSHRARRPLTLVASALTVALLAAGCSGGSSSPTPSGTATASASATATPSADQRTPATGTTGTVTVTDTGVVLGDPEAPERVVIYSDLACSHCKTLNGFMEADVARWSEGTDVAVEIVMVDFLGPRTAHDISMRGANLLALVADESPEAWPAVKHALYAVQPTDASADPMTAQELVDLATEAGATLGDDAVETLDSLAYSAWVQSTTEKVAESGITAIPQVCVDNELVSGSTHEETAAAVRTAVGE